MHNEIETEFFSIEDRILGLELAQIDMTAFDKLLSVPKPHTPVQTELMGIATEAIEHRLDVSISQEGLGETWERIKKAFLETLRWIFEKLDSLYRKIRKWWQNNIVKSDKFEERIAAFDDAEWQRAPIESHAVVKAFSYMEPRSSPKTLLSAKNMIDSTRDNTKIITGLTNALQRLETSLLPTITTALKSNIVGSGSLNRLQSIWMEFVDSIASYGTVTNSEDGKSVTIDLLSPGINLEFTDSGCRAKPIDGPLHSGFTCLNRQGMKQLLQEARGLSKAESEVEELYIKFMQYAKLVSTSINGVHSVSDDQMANLRHYVTVASTLLFAIAKVVNVMAIAFYNVMAADYDALELSLGTQDIR